MDKIGKSNFTTRNLTKPKHGNGSSGSEAARRLHEHGPRIIERWEAEVRRQVPEAEGK